MAKEAKTVETKERKKSVRRSSEERIAEIDAKISTHKATIAKLEAKKESILHPKARISKSAQMKALLNKAKENGMTNEEIAEKLGIELD